MHLIEFDERQQLFHLKNEQISYIMNIASGGYLQQVYFGKRLQVYSGIRAYPDLNIQFSPNPAHDKDRSYSLDVSLLEYPGNGFGDFRIPAHSIYHENGSQVTDLRFKRYEIRQGKPTLTSLPATYVMDASEAETLLIVLEDVGSKIEMELSYTIYKDRNVITRSTVVRNTGSENHMIKKAASMSLDFANRPFDLLQLHGSWGNERQLCREKISPGIKLLDSKRGASSHQHNPFVCLVEPSTDETHGEAYGFCLVYSGNHETMVERDQLGQTRVTMGINSFDFSWKLTAGESFQTPEVVMVYSEQGLNELSSTYHDLFNERLIRGTHKQKERPVLINNWEATYFDFSEEKLLEIIEEAQSLGIELFVLDDGWFGKREDDTTSLGDWVEFEGKLKNGLRFLSQEVHKRGMKFGLWLEPEMISPVSNLYNEHAEWAFHIPGRDSAVARSQYVLNFALSEVRDNIYQQLKAILDTVEVDYIKWDMNRNMTEVYSLDLPAEEQGSTAHRYMLGVYAFVERLRSDYPELLLEGCAGGGGRFDAGWLYYMPQIWTSDNSDAVSRLKIQYGTSLAYPPSSMGAHVSAIPNHQTQRSTSLATRGNVAMSGVLGYELDISSLTTIEKEEIKEQIAFYKQHRSLFQFGKFVRLLDPFLGNEAAWMFISKDKKEAVVFYFRVMTQAIRPLQVLKLQQLLPDRQYRVNGSDIYLGDELMYAGFFIDPGLEGDYASQLFHLKALEVE